MRLPYENFYEPEQEAAMEAKLLHRNLIRAISTLQMREQIFLCKAYGIEHFGIKYEERTYRKIAKEHRLSSGRPLQIINKVLRKLRHPDRKKLMFAEEYL